MANSADPDELPTDLDLHCRQRQDISEFSRTRVKVSIHKTQQLQGGDIYALELKV